MDMYSLFGKSAGQNLNEFELLFLVPTYCKELKSMGQTRINIETGLVPCVAHRNVGWCSIQGLC